MASLGSVEGKAWEGFRGNRSELDERTKDITESPGVYVFQDYLGVPIYVGKAKNLRKRLRSYFSSALPGKTEALMEKAAGLETIIVESEAEALILELTLIKRYSPKYNMRLKDDKHYPYIRVGLDEKWPRVTVARGIKKDGARYFGPFTRSSSVRETLSILRRLFAYRTCTDHVLAQVVRPCLDYHLGRCLGPCTGKLDEETYMGTIYEVIRFLEGKHKKLREELARRMMVHASELEFEAAARIRDQINSLDDITEKQRTVSPDLKDRDAVGLARSKEMSFVALLQVREGRLMGKEGFIISATSTERDEDVIEAFLTQYYAGASSVPPEVLVPVGLDSHDEIEGFLRERRREITPPLDEKMVRASGMLPEDSPKRQTGASVRVRVPRRGHLRDLTLMAGDNARTMMAEQLPKHEREAEDNEAAMENLQASLRMGTLPRRIEGYDISNISGQETVASMVVLSEGKPDKSSYRRFRMKIQGKSDDFAMMQEVLWRRFRKGMEEREKAASGGKAGRFSAFPDLVIVDGGKGQVSAAKAVLDELKLDIPLAGIAKKNEELFLPEESDPVILPRDSRALYLVMRLRDEAHRFAVSYHRKLRGDKALKSVLSDIPGIGPAKTKDLQSAFPDLQALRGASVEEIAKVKGIGHSLARTISAYFRSQPQS